jgi:hypothetical protein
MQRRNVSVIGHSRPKAIIEDLLRRKRPIIIKQIIDILIERYTSALVSTCASSIAYEDAKTLVNLHASVSAR